MCFPSLYVNIHYIFWPIVTVYSTHIFKWSSAEQPLTMKKLSWTLHCCGCCTFYSTDMIFYCESDILVTVKLQASGCFWDIYNRSVNENKKGKEQIHLSWKLRNSSPVIHECVFLALVMQRVTSLDATNNIFCWNQKKLEKESELKISENFVSSLESRGGVYWDISVILKCSVPLSLSANTSEWSSLTSFSLTFSRH